MRKHSLLRDLILLGVGGTLAIAGAVGGVVGGTALLALSINGKSLENATKLDLLSEDFENKNIIEIIQAIQRGDIDYMTLGGLAKISPKIEELYNQLQELAANYGLTLDKEAIYALNFEQYPEYFTNTITESFSIAGFLNANENSEAIIKYLCFHKNDQGEYEYDNPYTLKDMLEEGFFDTMITNLVLRDVLGDIPADNYLMNAIADWHISDFTDTDKVYGLKISDIYGTGNDGIVGAIENFSIADLGNSEKLEGLVIGSILGDIDTKVVTEFTLNELNEGVPTITVASNELVDDDGTLSTFRITFSNGVEFVYTKGTGEHEPSNVYLAEDNHYYVSKADNDLLAALAKYKISTLKNDPSKLRSSIKISDVVGDIADDNYVLKAIANYTIDELATGNVINGLTLTEILGPIGDDDYPLTSLKNETLTTLKDPDTIMGLTIEELLGPVDPSNTVLYSLKGYTLNQLSDDDTINGLTLEQLLGEIDSSNTVLYALKDKTILELKDPDTVGGLSLLTVLGQDAIDGSPLLTALQDKTLNELQDPDVINGLKISEILGDSFDYDSNAILKAFKDQNMTLADLQDSTKVNNAINGLKINEIIPGASGDSLIAIIGDYTIEELKGDAITNELTVGALIGNLNTGVNAEVNEISGIPAITITSNIKVSAIDGGDKYRITFSNDETFDYDVLLKAGETETAAKKTYIGKDGNYWVRMKDDSSLLAVIENWTMNDLKDESKINSIKVIDLLGMDESEITESGNPLVYALKDITLGELSEAKLKEAVNEIPVGAFLTNADSNPLLASLKDVKIKDLEGKINTLTFNDIIASDDPLRNEPLFEALKDKKVTEIGGVINDLTLKDLCGYYVKVKSNVLTTAGSTSDTYTITFEDKSVYPYTEVTATYNVAHAIDEETEAKPVFIDYTDEYYYVQMDEMTTHFTGVYAKPARTGIFKYLDKDTRLNDLTTAINTAKITTILQDDIFEEELGVTYIKPIWKFLLTPTTSTLSGKVAYESDPNKNNYESYTIQDMASLINNFQYWIQNAKLRELNDIGILGADGATLVDKEIGVVGSMALYGDATHATVVYGDLKLPDIITVLANI